MSTVLYKIQLSNYPDIYVYKKHAGYFLIYSLQSVCYVLIGFGSGTDDFSRLDLGSSVSSNS